MRGETSGLDSAVHECFISIAEDYACRMSGTGAAPDERDCVDAGTNCVGVERSGRAATHSLATLSTLTSRGGRTISRIE